MTGAGLMRLLALTAQPAGGAILAYEPAWRRSYSATFR